MVIMEDLFLRVGLQVNGKKTKAMAILPTLQPQPSAMPPTNAG